nr:reverse transcriptase domain-containing protein [Tanacetum cinerariifolium]
LVSKFINEFFPPSRTTNLRNEISNCFDESLHEAWDRYKYLLRACPHHGFTELHQLDTFYNAPNPADQDSLNSVTGGNLLERRTQDVLTIIENKSKVRNSRNKSIVSQVKSSDVSSSSSSEVAKLTHAINQQTSDVTTVMTAILKQLQATPPPAFCMRTRFSSNLVGESSPNPTTSNPKRRNRRHSKQPFSLEVSPVDTMADQRIMAELLRAPTEGYAEAIVVPPIFAEHFELKHSLINMMTSDQFFGHEKDNPHDHIRCPSLAQKEPPVLFSLGKILFPNSSMNSFLPQERQIFEMKFPTVLMNHYMRHGTVTNISFVHALIMVLPNCINLIPSTMPQTQPTKIL